MTRCLRLSFIDAVTLHPQACCATQSGVPEATVTRLSHNDATDGLRTLISTAEAFFSTLQNAPSYASSSQNLFDLTFTTLAAFEGVTALGWECVLSASQAVVWRKFTWLPEVNSNNTSQRLHFTGSLARCAFLAHRQTSFLPNICL